MTHRPDKYSALVKSAVRGSLLPNRTQHGYVMRIRSKIRIIKSYNWVQQFPGNTQETNQRQFVSFYNYYVVFT